MDGIYSELSNDSRRSFERDRSGMGCTDSRTIVVNSTVSDTRLTETQRVLVKNSWNKIGKDIEGTGLIVFQRFVDNRVIVNIYIALFF